MKAPKPKAYIQKVECPNCGDVRDIRRMSLAKRDTPYWCSNCRKTVKPKEGA